MSASSSSPEQLRIHLLNRLRSVMARTVANGCTEEEERAASRMVAKLSEQLDALEDARPAAQAASAAHWAKSERSSGEYQEILEKNTTAALFKAAVQELALSHINLVAPPQHRPAGHAFDRVGIHELLDAHLAMMLTAGTTQMGRTVLKRTIDELVYEGALPRFLDLPLDRQDS